MTIYETVVVSNLVNLNRNTSFDKLSSPCDTLVIKHGKHDHYFQNILVKDNYTFPFLTCCKLEVNSNWQFQFTEQLNTKKNIMNKQIFNLFRKLNFTIIN